MFCALHYFQAFLMYMLSIVSGMTVTLLPFLRKQDQGLMLQRRDKEKGLQDCGYGIARGTCSGGVFRDDAEPQLNPALKTGKFRFGRNARAL